MIRLSASLAGELESLLTGACQVSVETQQAWAAVLEPGGRRITVAVLPAKEVQEEADYLFVQVDILHSVRVEARQGRWTAKVCPYSDYEGLAGCLLSLLRAAAPIRLEKMKELQFAKAQNSIRDTLLNLDK